MQASVADRLRDMIFNRRWKPGDRLPPEHHLAFDFNVGRSSIREAIARLRAEGLLLMRPGVGTIVDSWLAKGSFEILRAIVRLKLGTPRAPEMVEDILWLRRTLYVQAMPLIIRGTPDLQTVNHELLMVRIGAPTGCGWRYVRHMLPQEEEVLCALAVLTDNIAVMLLANSIRRMLNDLIPEDEYGRELEPAQEKFEALVQAIRENQAAQVSQLLDALCRLREPEYLGFVTPTASSRTAPAPPSPSASPGP